MSIAPEKMSIFCPSCGKNLMVPISAAGKKGRCPSCKNVFPVQAPPSVATAQTAPLVELPPLQDDPFDYANVSDYTLQPLPPQSFAPPQPTPRQQYAPAEPARSGGSSIGEHVCESGMLTGLLMMAGAVAWFFAGLHLANRIYFYPPILFVLGLVKFLRGL